MKRILVGGIVLLVLAPVIAGCAGLSKEPAAPTPTAQAAPASVKTGGLGYGGQIIAEGQAVPVRSAALSLPSAGIVISVPVTLGQQVTAGQILAQLDTRLLSLELAQAEANVASAQARLDQLNQGPTAQDLAAAQQNVTSAQAAYDQVRAGPAASDVAAARAALNRGPEERRPGARRPDCRAVEQLGRTGQQRCARRSTRRRRPTTR